MKQGDLSQWNNIEACKNLLFFAQLVNELLFDYSIMNAVKAIHDYFDSARKIAPEYQQMAFDACITAVVTEMNNGNR